MSSCARTRTRKSAHLLTTTEKDRLKSAYAAMRKLPATDPRSMVAQSHVHCFFCGAVPAREMVDQNGQFIEVFVDASVDECARRDVKGLYEKAFRGEIKEFTGVSDPYEEPEQPEIRIESEHEEPGESAQRILALLEERGLIPAAVTV